MWLIPGKTKVQTEIFKGVSIADILIGAVSAVILFFLILSNLPFRFIIAVVHLFITALLLVRIDTEPNYIFLLHILRYIGYPRRFEKFKKDELLMEKKEKGGSQAAMDAWNKEAQKKQKSETKEQRKKRRKAQKAEKKADDKRLKDKNVSKEEKDAIWLKRAQASAERSNIKRKAKEENAEWMDMEDLVGFTDIKDGYIHYHGQYYGAAIEIPPVEFRFFSASRRYNTIQNGLGRILRAIQFDYAANIVKIERPIRYESYIENEYSKLDELRAAYESGMITEEELQARVEVIYDRINDLTELCESQPVVVPFFYLVLFDSDKQQLNNQVRSALESLRQGEMDPKRLDDKELAVFLKYTNQLDFDEKEIEQIDPEDYAAWALPDTVRIRPRNVEVNNIITHNMRLVGYPMLADDAWLASVMSIPATKVVLKCKPMDRGKSLRGIDRSLSELRAQYNSTGLDSKAIELQNHIESLSELLGMLQNENEILLNVNIYVTAYDISATRNNPKILEQPKLSNRSVISNMKKSVRRMYQEEGMRMNNMEFEQLPAFIGSQISAYDPCSKKGRGMPSNTIAASYPWVFSHVADANGVKLGSSDGVPVFIDFFRRDSERVNSNMVIVGKSGSGKSYATKSLLTNLAADDSKIFILDPENEYSELAENLHGKFINVGNAQYGRLNPFHIITALDDDEADGETVSGSYATHLQFLEEFFRQIIPECEKDAMEYLNSLVDRMYTNMGITAETDLSKLKPEDYPVFDDLYDEILQEFQQTDNEYIRKMLRTLMNYIAKFSTGGRNANIWNGPSTITTDENFTVFNFQSLLANRNTTIANAQMLLVLKYVDNEIIKNRDYNLKNNMHRKIVVVIDEAHVFIDEKFPIALDFMFQLAKRIRKYNGMQIVITQNIKDFVGTEEIARKSTAIINACQYSFIFSLAPNDMDDLCKLYEKAGGINENEQEQIVSAPRGQAFTVMSPSSRTTFKVEVPEDVVAMFQNRGYESGYFTGDQGKKNWENFIGDSRMRHDEVARAKVVEEAKKEEEEKKAFVTFKEISEEEAEQKRKEHILEKKRRSQRKWQRELEWNPEEKVEPELSEELPDIPDIPEDPEEFAKIVSQKKPVEEIAPVEEVSEAPAAESAAAVQQPAQSVSTEQLLSNLLERFSYDAILQEVRRAVQEEMLHGNIQDGVAAGMTNALGSVQQSDMTSEKESGLFDESDMNMDMNMDMEESGTQDTDTGYTEEEEDTEDWNMEEMDTEASGSEESTDEEEEDIFASLFGSISDEDEDETEDMADESEEDDDDDDFDIFSFLDEQAEMEKEISSIEKMEVFNETVIEISLEELALYNRNLKKGA